MRNRLLYLMSLLFLAACGSSQETVATVSFKPVAVNYTSSTVKNAAETGLPAFIGTLGDQWGSYGFMSPDELALAHVSAPYPVFVLDNPGKIDQSIRFADEWEFPVMVNGSKRCMLKVVKMNDQWQAVNIGSASLSGWLQVTESDLQILNLTTKGIVQVYGFWSSPYKILITNPSEEQPSFFLVPHATELVNRLPLYRDWVPGDRLPALSFQEIYTIFSTVQ